MDNIINFIQSNNNTILFVLMITTVLLLLIMLSSQMRISKLKKKYDLLLKDVDSVNLEDVLFEHLEKVNSVKEELRVVDGKCMKLDQRLRLTLQNVGIIRYNAFDDMGSDLSFSLAMLDDNLDGVIITSLYGRDGCSIYGKPVKGSETKYTLSKEETEALQIASSKRNSKK
ncbi:DUF4446 family protein [Clostridiaceae bacterium M8S5]|nr:DUF4446 family protein [Clostridiaceae bacterium M8S5]